MHSPCYKNKRLNLSDFKIKSIEEHNNIKFCLALNLVLPKRSDSTPISSSGFNKFISVDCNSFKRIECMFE